MSIKGQIVAAHLVPRGILDPVEWDHIAVVGLGHIEVGKYLGFVAVQVSSISQLARDTCEERGRLCSTTRGGRRLTRGWHCVV